MHGHDTEHHHAECRKAACRCSVECHYDDLIGKSVVLLSVIWLNVAVSLY
jgi:hypothetical protein